MINQIIVDNFDHVIQERNNTYVAFRKVRWSDEEDAPTYLDLRKYRTNPDGSEFLMKGVSFQDDGANELTYALLEEGYGDTRIILNNIKDREDFNVSLVRALSGDDADRIRSAFPELNIPEADEVEEEFYDIRRELGE